MSIAFSRSKPPELPIQLPTKFEMVVNSRPQALGLAVPIDTLPRQVIEEADATSSPDSARGGVVSSTVGACAAAGHAGDRVHCRGF